MKIRSFLIFSIFISISCFAGSLWAQSNQKSFYTEEKAHKVGDILTVIISESASATQTATKDTSKEFSTDMNAGTGFLRRISGGTAGSTKDFSGSGSTLAQNRVNATISVKVIEVLPNRNIVVEGKRFINVNDDIQEITLHGEVRPRDISTSNTIDSKLLADAKINYKGHGDVARSQRPNLFQRIIGFIF